MHYEFTCKTGGERTDKFLALQDTGITRSFAFWRIIAFLFSLMSSRSLSALLTVDADTPQAAAISFNETIVTSPALSQSFKYFQYNFIFHHCQSTAYFFFTFCYISPFIPPLYCVIITYVFVLV